MNMAHRETRWSLAINCVLFLLILLAVVLFTPTLRAPDAKAAEPTSGLVPPISTVLPATDTEEVR